MAQQDLFNMSDDDISKMSFPPEEEQGELPLEEQEEVKEKEEEEEVEEKVVEEDSEKEVDDADDKSDDANPAYNAPDDDNGPIDDKFKIKEPIDESKSTNSDFTKNNKDEVKNASSDKTKDQVEPKDKQQETKSEDKTAINYEAAYKELMAPFKANGKEISLTSAQEAKQLMQMGANYTKKLQSLQPNLKMMKMLEVNGLMNENQISFLIDVAKKDPDAIKKLLKDSNIDPMDIDTSEESKYEPKNHRISDEQMRFDSVIEEVLTDPAGSKVVVDIDKNWDQESKKVLYKDPSILSVMAQQKAAGIYDQIADEVERQKVLGNLNGVSYITAYHQVGQALQQQGLLRTPKSQGSEPQPQQHVEQAAPRQESQSPEILDRRPAPRKPADPNSDRARATTPVRSSTKTSTQEYNPLSMSDEEFEKTANMASRY